MNFTIASTLDEALVAVASGARPIAGGSDLVVGARHGKAPMPDSVVAIDRIESLGNIEPSAGGVRIGALVTHARLEIDDGIVGQYTGLADASALVGSPATRHVGTIGGNVMNASPAMETGGPLICFDAVATLRSSSGQRDLAVAELFTGPGHTVANPDELLIAIALPAPAAGTGSCYARLEYRRQMEIAIVGATAVVTLNGGAVTDARIAITALAPTIHRVPEAEAALVGSDGGGAAMQAAANAAAAASKPISDVRGSADYRRAMAAVITRRAIAVAIARARGEQFPIPASPALHGAVDGGAA
jgi:CO/xanthine dehydrogenase FAD-binding subunit